MAWVGGAGGAGVELAEWSCGAWAGGVCPSCDWASAVFILVAWANDGGARGWACWGSAAKWCGGNLPWSVAWPVAAGA